MGKDCSGVRKITSGRPARMAASMVALALALAGCGGNGPQAAAITTATAPLIPMPTAPPSPWIAVADLNTVATIAPNQFKTQFKAFAGVTSKTAPPEIWVRRSDNYGATYHDVSLPPIPGGATATNVTYLSGDPSSLNPSVYFLTAQTNGSCGGTTCQYQYVTMDGGTTWKLLSLPVHGILGVKATSGATGRTQGQLLYGVVTDIILNTSGVVPPGRLVVSNDGGVTWSVADAAIFAASQWIYNFAPAADGSAVFALAGQNFGTGLPTHEPTLSVWRSDDAGASWKKEGPLPGAYSLGVLATTSATSGQTILYVLASDASNDFHLYASSDGGATWPATYDFHKGRDLNMLNAFPGLIATLPDSSVLIASYDYSTLEWNPTLTAPRTLLPAPPNAGFVQSELVVPPDGAGRIRLWITSADSNGKATYDYTTVPQ